MCQCSNWPAFHVVVRVFETRIALSGPPMITAKKFGECVGRFPDESAARGFGLREATPIEELDDVQIYVRRLDGPLLVISQIHDPNNFTGGALA